MAGTEGGAKPRLAVVVGSGSASVREVLRYGADIAEPVLVFDAADSGDVSLSGLRAMLEDEVECVGYGTDDPAGLLELHGRAPLSAITTFAEDKIRLTAEIAALLSLPYHSPEVAHTLTDKAAQRAALARAGLGIGFGAAEDAAEAVELVRQLGVECVVKPRTGAGSRHTYAVRPQDADSLYDLPAELFPAVVEARLETGRHPRSELLADVVSVETVFSGGRPRHLGVSGRFRLAEPFRETGMVFPSQLPEPLLAEVFDVATRALAGVGVTTGATHTELKLTPDGPRVVEINGRLGGDVGRLTELSTGTNAVELVLRAVCGLSVEAPLPTAVAGVAMLVPPVEATRLDSRVPARELRAVDGVVAVDVHTRPGDRVDYRTGWWAHVACVWYRAEDWPALGAAHTAALDLAGRAIEWG
ncbi:acetyl-CoA carboxylase biotin carboxylase subunit family protein [Streptomyces sp. NPDC059740]|uniref:ATP-grasp domain-containing protein n=1 Tax=Streptomyces sp. NPDC059740 TaxID=3346926 RepID=UPI00364EAA9B